MSCDLRLRLQNSTGRVRTIRLEPWARHFLLGPGEKLEIVATTVGDSPSFRMVEANETTLIYTEGPDRVSVFQDGITHELLPVYEVDAAPAPPNHINSHPMFDNYID